MIFTTVARSAGAGFVEERTEYRTTVYFDGRREARLQFVDGKLEGRNINRLLDFEEDRMIFAGIFQYFYLRLAIFFGCLGIFMYLFRGEMSNRTLHFWFLAPARREVLLAGKYAAGLIASAAIFGGGALLTLAALLWPHDAVEVQAYWNAGGMGHVSGMGRLPRSAALATGASFSRSDCTSAIPLSRRPCCSPGKRSTVSCRMRCRR